jgi:hypothetical protein
MSEPAQLPKIAFSPALMIGAASPLWGYFAAAAAGGVAYWWMTQMTRPANLEALFAKLPPGSAENPVAAIQTAALPEQPLGGESAPLSPLAAASEPEPRSFEPEPEPAPRSRKGVAATAEPAGEA